MANLFTIKRKSFLEYDTTYFWTCTIKDWKKLLEPERYKDIVVASLKKLVVHKFIELNAFVIMPNHVHLILKLLKPNGKEKPCNSFLKETSHQLRKELIINHPHILPYFKVAEADRIYRIWQRDSLAIDMFDISILEQKLDYIHNNPLQEKWKLAASPEDYYWSSAKFYNDGIDDFKILTHYRNSF